MTASQPVIPRERVTKRYLNARKMRAGKAGETVTEWVSEWSQLQISTSLGQPFRRTQRIRLERPRWMPRWLFFKLMAAIVVDWVPEERA